VLGAKHAVRRWAATKTAAISDDRREKRIIVAPERNLKSCTSRTTRHAWLYVQALRSAANALWASDITIAWFGLPFDWGPDSISSYPMDRGGDEKGAVKQVFQGVCRARGNAMTINMID
jgi:hypothetical protein